MSTELSVEDDAVHKAQQQKEDECAINDSVTELLDETKDTE